MRAAWCKAVGSSLAMSDQVSPRALAMRIHRRADSAARDRPSRPNAQDPAGLAHPGFGVCAQWRKLAMAPTSPNRTYHPGTSPDQVASPPRVLPRPNRVHTTFLHSVFIVYWSHTGMGGVFDSVRAGMVWWYGKVVWMV